MLSPSEDSSVEHGGSQGGLDDAAMWAQLVPGTIRQACLVLVKRWRLHGPNRSTGLGQLTAGQSRGTRRHAALTADPREPIASTRLSTLSLTRDSQPPPPCAPYDLPEANRNVMRPGLTNRAPPLPPRPRLSLLYRAGMEPSVDVAVTRPSDSTISRSSQLSSFFSGFLCFGMTLRGWIMGIFANYRSPISSFRMLIRDCLSSFFWGFFCSSVILFYAMKRCEFFLVSVRILESWSAIHFPRFFWGFFPWSNGNFC